MFKFVELVSAIVDTSTGARYTDEFTIEFILHTMK